MKKTILLFVVFMLSACGAKKIEGEYVGKDMLGKNISLTFKPDGKLVIQSYTLGGTPSTSEIDYKTDGNKVNVAMGMMGVVSITQNDDGSLNAPAILGGILTKK